MSQKLPSTGVLLLLLVVPAVADTVELNSGEKFVGTLVRMEGGKMIFNSVVVGEITIPMDQVRNINTDDPVTMHLEDGRVNRYRIQGFTGDAFTVDGESGSRRIASSDLSAMNPSPPPPDVDWSGSVSLGLTKTTGNTKQSSGSLSANVIRTQRKTEERNKSRWSTKALYVFSRDEVKVRDAAGEDDGEESVTTEASATVTSKYDYFFSDTYYGFINGSWKKDHIADLERRLIGGVGVGKEWIDDGEYLFTTDAGAAFRHETFEHPEDTNDEISAQLGYNFSWVMNEKFHFLHDLVYYPSVEDVSAYFVTSSAELRAKLAADWFASLKAIMDYDSTASESSSKSTDMKYIFSLTYTF